MTVTVALAAGGTAGHVNPMVATARALTAMADVHVIAIGTAHGMEVSLLDDEGIELETIPRVPMPRRPNLYAVKFPKLFAQSVAQAGEILDRHHVGVVVGFGGYVSTPVYLAAKKRGIPVIAHEGNAKPGMANRLGARFAKVLALAFGNTSLKARRGRTEVIGMPMRRMIVDLAHAEGGRTAHRAQYAREFGLDPEKPIVVVTGGSSGAAHINEVIEASASMFIERGIQLFHLTGRGKADNARAVSEEFSGGGYVVREYLSHMDQVYSLADLVITRAGAGMVCEVSALGIPAVFVPLPIGNGEQALNAHDVVEAGGALMVSNADFSEQWIAENVLPLFTGNRLADMARRASAVSPLDAAERLAAITLEAVK